MWSVRLKVEFPAVGAVQKKLVFCFCEITIDAEAIASTLAGSPADNRPANRGPSLCQCWGRWTQEAEPVVKEMSESASTEVQEH